MSHALLLPGLHYGPSAPLLAYASEVVGRRGATVHLHTWSPDPPGVFSPAIEAWIQTQVTTALDGLATTGDAPPLVIGKSLGTNAAGLAADRKLPAVWLTPLLHLPWVVDAMRRAGAPMLLVGGTADRSWDSAIANDLSPYVVEVPDADHGLMVPGPVVDSVAVLARVVVAIEEFLDTVGWPTGKHDQPSDRS
jgi:hypothetical protein